MPDKVFLVMSLLLLAACGKTQSSSKSMMVRYIEEAVSVKDSQMKGSYFTVQDIMAYMLGEESQKTDTKEGFPVRQSTLEEWLKGNEINHNLCSMGGGYDESKMVEAFWEENHSAIALFEEQLKAMEVPIIRQSFILRDRMR